MKFSYRQFPILNHLDNYKSLVEFQEYGLTKKIESEFTDLQFEGLIAICDLILESKTIEFVSVPFFKKILDEKIYKKLTSLYNEIKPCEGILLYPKKVFSQIHAISYVIFPHTKNDESVMVAELQLYSDLGRIAILYIEITNDSINWKAVMSEIIESINDLDTWVINHIQSFSFFAN